MKLTFLCATHRQVLEAKTAQAIRFWQDGFDTAQFFFEQGLWAEAIPHIGCAFETAEILITNRSIDYPVACDWFYTSTVLLANTFNKLGYEVEAREVLRMAIERFERELESFSIDNIMIVQYLQSLRWSNSLANCEDGCGELTYGTLNLSVH